MVVKIIKLYQKPRFKIESGIKVAKEYDLTADEVIDIILRKFKLKPRWFWRWLTNKCRIYIADPFYKTVDNGVKSELCRLCSQWLGDKRWIENIFDCDDFSYVLRALGSLINYEKRKGYAIGIIWICSRSEGWCHATNFVINSRKEFEWFEPQICGYLNFDIYNVEPILIVI